ncbi:MAG TPA: M28 family peptidase, partial [Chondromyces sp.]|nr:M28 family peptidase [Chondromyces sp.]
MSMKKKRIISLAVSASLLTGVTAVSAAPPQTSNVQAQSAFDNKITKSINVENIYQHIEELSKEPRVAGTAAEYRAVQYIKDQFESYGYKTEIQPFTFESYIAPTAVSLSVNGQALSATPFTYTTSGSSSAELVLAGLGKESDFEGKDIEGKIALIERGEISFGEKVLNATNAGAVGVIIYNNTEGEINGTLGEWNASLAPAVSLTQAQGEALIAQLEENGSLSVSLTVEGAKIEETTSHNVIATKLPTNKKKATNQIVMAGSHHDSVAGAPGANDDASGVAVTLELARVLANKPTDTEIRFMTFGAEELGLLGSYHYVDTLTEDEIDRTAAMFQMDMVGSRDAGDLVMFTVDGEKNTVTELGAAAGVRTGTPLTYGAEGRSDHVPF